MRKAFVAVTVIAVLLVSTVAMAANVRGTRGDDVLKGTGQADTLTGLRGDDLMLGKAGDDQIGAGPGHDQLFGQGGNDILKGRFGDDQLTGGGDFVEFQSDVFNCGPGVDTVFNAVAGVDIVNDNCENVNWVALGPPPTDEDPV